MGLREDQAGTPLTERELVEFVLHLAPGDLAPGAKIWPLLEPPPPVVLRAQDECDRSVRAEIEHSSEEARHKPVWARRARTRLPPEKLLDAAWVHARGLEPRRVALFALARTINLDPATIAEGLNRNGAMVSLPAMEAPLDIRDWPRIYQLAAALGTNSTAVRTRALTEYAQSDMWDWAHLPLDAQSDAMLAWMADELRPIDPNAAIGVMTTLVNSPEAFRVLAGRFLQVLDEVDTSVFGRLVRVLAGFPCYASLVREDPVRRLVQEVVRGFIERCGDSTLTALGLGLLVGDGVRSAAPPTSRDLALAATVATFVASGRPGWRNPLLRPALVEAALHGAPGCRRAALVLGLE